MTHKKTPKKAIALFEGKEIRKVRHNEERWFVLTDVIFVLTESVNTQEYIKKMRSRDDALSKGWGQIVTPLWVDTSWWMQKVNCANTEGILRIIQSIPSPRAEPFKQWLAKVWYERIQEINDPELSMKRMIETYKKKWYPQEWIDIRSRWIPVRKWLTNERDQRWWEKAYWLLTNEIYKAYAWMDNKEWMEHKWMEKWNLRDGMSPIELILTMLAEQSTTDISKARDAKGIPSLKKASKDWWWVAYKARKELIQQTWKDPITDKHYLEALWEKDVTPKIKKVINKAKKIDKKWLRNI
jgi:DNA-damage-inducible protein D